MSSWFQDYATKCICNSIKRGNAAILPYRDGYIISDYFIRSEYKYSSAVNRIDLFARIDYKCSDGFILHETYAFEIKSSSSDLKSGCGVNFVSEKNFLVVPDGSLDGFYGINKMDGRNINDYMNGKYTNVGILKINRKGEVICVRPSRNPNFPWLDERYFGDYIYEDDWIRPCKKRRNGLLKTG